MRELHLGVVGDAHGGHIAVNLGPLVRLGVFVSLRNCWLR